MPLPDFFIGAHAKIMGWQLATTDRSRFRHILPIHLSQNAAMISHLRRMKPAPTIAITRFGADVHSFWKAEKDLPLGIVPSVIKSWPRCGDKRVFCMISRQ
jgi:hypothetical protein